MWRPVVYVLLLEATVRKPFPTDQGMYARKVPAQAYLVTTTFLATVPTY